MTVPMARAVVPSLSGRTHPGLACRLKGGVNTMSPAVCLRIVVLHTEVDVWCDICAVPSAVTITYVAEEIGNTPGVLHQLTYCETCEDR